MFCLYKIVICSTKSRHFMIMDILPLTNVLFCLASLSPIMGRNGSREAFQQSMHTTLNMSLKLVSWNQIVMLNWMYYFLAGIDQLVYHIRRNWWSCKFVSHMSAKNCDQDYNKSIIMIRSLDTLPSFMLRQSIHTFLEQNEKKKNRKVCDFFLTY